MQINREININHLLESIKSIYFQDDGKHLYLHLPSSFLPVSSSSVIASDVDLEHQNNNNLSLLTFRGIDALSRYCNAQLYFSRCWNRPIIPFFDLNKYQPPTDPIMSCIIVINENDKYVRNIQLPSLLSQQNSNLIELIIVNNGSRSIEYLNKAFSPFRVIDSEWGCVGRAYQAGADASSAEILAFLHDDCMPTDQNWLVTLFKTIQNNGIGIISQEVIPFQLGYICDHIIPPLPHAKAYPLVITRANLELVGGWDINHFIGFEELDLSLATLDHSLDVRQMEIGFLHESGLSTILKYLVNHSGLREAFGLGAIPADVISRLHNAAMSKLSKSEVGRIIARDQLRYVLQSHPKALEKVGTRNVHSVMSKLKTLYQRDGSILDRRSEMVDFDRNISITST